MGFSLLAIFVIGFALWTIYKIGSLEREVVSLWSADKRHREKIKSLQNQTVGTGADQ